MTAMTALTHKTKPLGPRQRLAYVKPFRAELAAAKATLEAQRKAAIEAEAAHRKGIARIAATAIVVKAQAPLSPTLTTTLQLHSYELHLSAKSTPAERRKARKALLAGEIAISVNGGAPKLHSLVRRFRAMSKPDISKLRSLDRRIAELRRQRDLVIELGFERGIPYTPERLADLIIAKATLPSDYHYIDEYAVTRAENALADALKHDGTRTCPCNHDVQLRAQAVRDKEWADRRAAEAKAEARRLAKLGTRDFTCPSCNEANVKSQIDTDENEGRLFVECASCGEGVLLEDLVDQDKVAAASPGQAGFVLDSGYLRPPTTVEGAMV